MKRKTRGRKPAENNPLAADNAELQKKTSCCEKSSGGLRESLRCKKNSEILGIQQDLNDLENDS